MSRIAGILAAEAGLSTRSALSAAGVSRSKLSRYVKQGRLLELLPGVVTTPDQPIDVSTRLRAALLYAGPASACTGQTALWLMGITQGATPFEIAVPNGRRVRSVPSVVSISQRRSGATVTVAGLMAVPPVEALAHVAATRPADTLRFCAAEAVRTRIVVPRDLAGAVPASRGRRALRMVSEEIQAGAVSGGEAKYWRLLKDAGIRLPTLNTPVLTDSGRYYVDSLWAEFGLGVEIDGRSVHAQAAAFDADRRRQNAIYRSGVVLVRFTVAQVMNEGELVVAHTSSALRARAAELGMPAFAGS